MSGHVYRIPFITRDQVRARRNAVFMFGDNMQRKGYGGQAKHMRGEPNAVGVPTKWAPNMRPESFFSDDDFAEVRPSIDAAFNRIRQELAQGLDVVIPIDGVGTGLADLPRRAPCIHRYIEDQIAALAPGWEAVAE